MKRLRTSAPGSISDGEAGKDDIQNGLATRPMKMMRTNRPWNLGDDIYPMIVASNAFGGVSPLYELVREYASGPMAFWTSESPKSSRGYTIALRFLKVPSDDIDVTRRINRAIALSFPQRENGGGGLSDDIDHPGPAQLGDTSNHLIQRVQHNERILRYDEEDGREWAVVDQNLRLFLVLENFDDRPHYDRNGLAGAPFHATPSTVAKEIARRLAFDIETVAVNCLREDVFAREWIRETTGHGYMVKQVCEALVDVNTLASEINWFREKSFNTFVQKYWEERQRRGCVLEIGCTCELCSEECHCLCRAGCSFRDRDVDEHKRRE